MDNIKIDTKEYDGEASIWLTQFEVGDRKYILMNFWVL